MGLSGLAKSMVTSPPVEQAVWSISPQGFPKKLFSAYCPIMAFCTGSNFPLLKRSLKMAPRSTSKDADDDKPDPLGTPLSITAWKPPMRYFNSFMREATPRTNAEEVKNSFGLGARSFKSTENGG